MFPLRSAERAPAARGIRRKIIKILLLVEWCFIGENSKEGITLFYEVGEEVMKKEIIKERAGASIAQLRVLWTKK